MTQHPCVNNKHHRQISSLTEGGSHALPFVVVGETLVEAVVTPMVILIEIKTGTQQVKVLVIMLCQHQ